MFQLTSVNVIHPVFLSRVAIDNMSKREAHGLIVNVSNLLELYPVGGMTMYCATKAFIHHFAIALGIELERDKELKLKG